MKELKACIFDMDGVVIDNKEFHIEAWRKYSGMLGFRFNYHEVKSWFGATNEVILRILYGDKLTIAEMKSMGEQKESIYRELYEKSISPLKGLLDFIEDIRKAGLKTGLATSAPNSNVRFVMDKTGLRESFDTIVDASMITNGKPDPEIFLKAAMNLKVEPECIVVFEDSFHGIRAAKDAGMKVIGLATTHEAAEIKDTDLIIRDFTEINISKLKELFVNPGS